MELHLVTGFLGAGKTTTIINCCKALMAQGKKVAVITNDQGKYLVDTAFMRAADIPAMEVQSGCFCSHYQDMVEQLDDLKKSVNPDVVFAEAIGSAANLVGTVMQPLIEGSRHHPDSLSAVVDARLMLRLLNGEYLPFSDSVTATFKAQIRESNYLIINKIDLLTKVIHKQFKDSIKKHYPQKQILLQSAHNNEDILAWYKLITSKNLPLMPDASFDHKRHNMALEKLIWDERITEYKHQHNVFPDIIKDIEKLLANLASSHSTIAHIKAFIEYDKQSLKFSITTLDQVKWKDELEGLNAKNAKVILNMRVQK